MPVWDFICGTCHTIRMDQIVLHGSPMPRCCGMEMEKSITGGRTTFSVTGFSSANGYTSPRTIPVKSPYPGMHVYVTEH